jgi:beta-glucanase (GH16 family)
MKIERLHNVALAVLCFLVFGGIGCGSKGDPKGVLGVGGETFITSGKVDSQNNQSWAISSVFSNPTIIEARIKLPKTANGLWPAFWMLGSNYDGNNWPACGEIDIMEMGNHEGIITGTQEKHLINALHYGPSSSANAAVSNSFVTNASLQDGNFHVFKVACWNEGGIFKSSFSVDGSFTNYLEGTASYFNQNFFILFNLAVGGKFTDNGNGNLSVDSIIDLITNKGQDSIYDRITALNANNNWTAKMYVDWVKVNNNIEDNFSNLSSWNIINDDRGGGNQELQYYSSENVTIENNVDGADDGNCLVIIAKRQ